MRASPSDDSTRLVCGKGRFVDDLHPGNPTHLGFVRSQYAHALIKSIDFSSIVNSPELVTCIAGSELQKELDPLCESQGQRPTGRFHLAVDNVRFVGEPVAAVLAKRFYAVQDLVEQVRVEYEPLPVVATIGDSKMGKQLVYEKWQDNLSFQLEMKRGDVETAIATAPHVIKTRLGIARQAGIAIEPRSVMAHYVNEKDVLTVHATVQSVHRLQNYLSQELRIGTDRIRVRAMDVGGAFGTRNMQSYPETAIACLLAMKTGLPVKWKSTRTDVLLETNQGRDEYAELELACDAEGKILALRSNIEADIGVGGSFTPLVRNTIRLLPSVYKIPNIDLRGFSYVTNKAPYGPVRGAGRPEACLFIERAIDIMAKRLGLDPLEFRRRNLIGPAEFPYDNGAGGVYDSGNFPLLLETLMKASKYESLKKWRKRVNQSQSGKLAGIGISMEIDDTGALLTETANATVTNEGKILIFTGSCPQGQGLEFAFAQLASKELDVPLAQITIKWGDTSEVASGTGTFASRSAAVGGSAVVSVCRELRAKIIQKVVELSGRRSEALRLKNASIFDGRERLFTLRTLVARSGEVRASVEYKLESLVYSSGAHLCALILDKETGKVEIKKYVAVDDCGTIINPEIVDGQVHGGVAHGIGGVLLEEVLYDKECQQLSTNLTDYLIPSATDIPKIVVANVETPSPMSLNGAKGIGESGTIAAFGAVFNAINDALSQAGAELSFVPATSQRIFDALRSK